MKKYAVSSVAFAGAFIFVWLVMGMAQKIAMDSPSTEYLSTFKTVLLKNQWMGFMQAVFLLLIFWLGWFLLAAAGRGISSILHILYSFPCGLAALYAAVSLLVNLHLPFTIVSLVLCLLFLSIAIVVARKAFKLPAQLTVSAFTPKLFFVSAGVLVAAGAATLVPIKSLGYDCFLYYQIMGQLTAGSGKLAAGDIAYPLEVGAFQPFTSSAAWFFEFSQTFGVQYLLSAVTAAVLAYTVWHVLPIRKKKLWRCLITAGIVLFCWTQPAVVHINAWLLSNVYAMCYMLLALAALYWTVKGWLSRFSGGLALGLVSLAMCMTRIEGMLFLLLLAIVAIPLSLTKKQLVFSILLPSTIVFTLYYGDLLFIRKFPSSVAFMQTNRFLLLLAAAVCTILYCLFIRDNILNKYIWPISVACMLAVNAAAFYLHRQQCLTNIKMLFINITSWNYWGVGALLFVIYGALLLYSKFQLSQWDIFIIGYILITMFLYSFRTEPLRIALADSGNRSFMQLVPVICIAVTVKLADVVVTPSRPVTSTSPCYSNITRPTTSGGNDFASKITE